MRDIIGMVLAGDRVRDLSVLTARQNKAAVSFGGQYRLIDFALSNLVESGVEKIGVMSLYRPYSLISHLGSGEPWDLIGRGRGIEILPPYLDEEENRWYRGTADAIYQNIEFIQDHSPQDVLILSGDHVYHMDFLPFIEQHRKTGADLTMVVKEMEPSIGQGRFGIVEIDDQARVMRFQDSPKQPASRYVSLTIYLFKTDVLITRLIENIPRAKNHKLQGEIIPTMVEKDNVYAYLHEGYWSYVRSVDAYYRTHMDLLGDEPVIQLNRWNIRTRIVLRGLGDLPPVRHESGSVCIRSIVSSGCCIKGEIFDSVIGPGVCVEEGATVKNSILMQNAWVKSKACVDRSILDKNVIVGEQAHLGDSQNPTPNQHLPESLNTGITLIGAGTQIPDKARIGANCVVFPGLKLEDWQGNPLKSGQTLGPKGQLI